MLPGERMAKDPVQSVLDLYPRIYFACHTRHVRDPASGRTLSAHRASILDHLDEVEPLTLNALAEHLGVTAGTMCVHVDRLVRHGYVLRRRDPRDGRRAQLRLSAAGRRVREAKSVLDPDRVRRMLDGLDTGARQDALRGLALLADAADASVRSSRARGRKRR
jgi:MarR family transcriptional regulator, organic hydroperoxide resistance regulator